MHNTQCRLPKPTPRKPKIEIESSKIQNPDEPTLSQPIPVQIRRGQQQETPVTPWHHPSINANAGAHGHGGNSKWDVVTE